MDQNNIPKDVSMEQIMGFANSPAGQMLIRTLQKKNDPNLQNAVQMASSGNMDEAKKALSSLMNDPQIQALLKQFGG